jgi:hypothetical protein
LLIALYSLALLASASLLFVLEPMVGKLVLPLLGSSPQVWTATVLFFQVALLAGYAYAHLSSRLRPRVQAALQVALLAAGAVSLPIAISHPHPPASSNPVLWLLGLLFVTAGLPFIALAANAPLLQRWLSGRHPNPYFLYAVSNAGSLIGLIAYPLLVERFLTLHAQGVAWATAYGVAFALVVASAVVVRPRREPVATSVDPPETPRRRLRWAAIAFVPSSLMLGTTTFITRDLTPVPLLWVIPLALYLLTFVVAFAPGVNPGRIAAATRFVLPAVVIVIAYTLAIGSQRPLSLLLPLHLVGLTVAALMCHSRLAADRPATERLTSFYLYVAAGGALGGVFNALVAPLVFPTLIEYPLAIVAACALIPAAPKTRPALLEFFLRDPRPTKLMDFLAPALVLGALAIALASVSGFAPRSALIGIACGLVFNLARRPPRFALSVGAILLAAALAGSSAGAVLARDRSFFGIYKVVSDAGSRYLYDGTTLHGIQRGGAPVPLSYYNRAGPAGQAFRELPRGETRSAALIGLGAGALACYAHPGDRFTFFEVDPVVARIARGYFSYLRDCPARVAIGDGRLSLARSGRFGTVVLDAFTSDAIPIHLITTDAMRVYLRHGRAVLFHISNRYLALEPVLGDVAKRLRLICLSERHVPTARQVAAGYSLSQWALLARTRTALGAVASDRRWHRCRSDGGPPWTDDYSDLFGAIKWG